MLEIPESRTVAQQLCETVRGKTILNVTAGFSPHKFAWFFGDPEAYHPLLSGKSINRCDAYGGLVELCAQDARIVLGEGVNLRYWPPGVPVPQKHQLHIEFEDFSSLTASVQMYGGLFAFREGENDNFYYLVAKQKISPLDDAFDYAYFCSLREGLPEILSAKAFLATEQRIPGLGNGVLQDILWRAKIHPKTRVSELDSPQFEALFGALKQTLQDMTLQGGRNTERDLYGAPGGYVCILCKNTLDTPCPACGEPIQRAAYLGGNIYFCPHCQPYTKEKRAAKK